MLNRVWCGVNEAANWGLGWNSAGLGPGSVQTQHAAFVPPVKEAEAAKFPEGDGAALGVSACKWEVTGQERKNILRGRRRGVTLGE